MFPSECLLERIVRVHADEDLDATNLPLFILKCKDRKAEGYAANILEIHNQWLKDMVIGVRLADAPPAVSYLVILRSEFLSADIVAVSKTVIVIRLDIPVEVGLSYLIYDAVALSLRMIPAPEDPSWAYTPCSRVSVARPCGGPDYALVHTGLLLAARENALFLWRPSSLPLPPPPPPWSEHKRASLRFEWGANSINTEFSFNGHAYWVDLLDGVFYCSCDALFDDNMSVVKFRRFIPLPVPPAPSDDDDDDHSIACPDAYRTIGVVCDCLVRFVSIDGFQDYVKLKKRTVTVWKLLGHNNKWKQEYKMSLETLWGFEGFGPVRKDLTPMYPLLSTQDMDVIYLALGKYREDRFDRTTFYPLNPCYLLAVDMRNKIVLSSVPLDEENWYSALISCGFSQYLGKALVGPCDDKGIPMKKKKKRRCGGGNVAEAPIPMKKQPSLEKRRSIS